MCWLLAFYWWKTYDIELLWAFKFHINRVYFVWVWKFLKIFLGKFVQFLCVVLVSFLLEWQLFDLNLISGFFLLLDNSQQIRKIRQVSQFIFYHVILEVWHFNSVLIFDCAWKWHRLSLLLLFIKESLDSTFEVYLYVRLSHKLHSQICNQVKEPFELLVFQLNFD